MAKNVAEPEFTHEVLRAVNARLAEIQRVMPGALLVIAGDHTIAQVNAATLALLGYSEDVLTGTPVERLWPRAFTYRAEVCALGDAPHPRSEEIWIRENGRNVSVLVSSGFVEDATDDVGRSIACIGLDLSERKKLEIELRHAHKMDSIGQLAAGIAHEINTPMQFIGDNVHFLGNAFTSIMELLDAYADSGAPDTERVKAARERADVEFLRSRLPRAVDRTLSGVARVNRIVSAMKAFAHPDFELSFFDVNSAVENTLTVSASELKYVADISTQFGDVPHVYGNASDISQVVLNLVVNAAHAITAANRGRGLVTVTTTAADEGVTIAVTDTGCGIPPDVRDRVFEPFFTTKPVGQGTGQGLALAHALVVKKHGGALTFETEVGRGTTFTVRLPKRAARAA